MKNLFIILVILGTASVHALEAKVICGHGYASHPHSAADTAVVALNSLIKEAINNGFTEVSAPAIVNSTSPNDSSRATACATVTKP